MVDCVGWFATVVAAGFALHDDCPVAFVFGVAVFFRHCYRAASGLLSFVLHQVARWARAFVRFLDCISAQIVIQDRVMMLYPSGCLNPITMHHLVDYVYDSPRRLTHCLSCSRFCARRSNDVPVD